MVLWNDVLGPMYRVGAAAFDPTQLVGVQFHVTANNGAPVPFNFCISNLTLLTSP